MARTTGYTATAAARLVLDGLVRPQGHLPAGVRRARNAAASSACWRTWPSAASRSTAGRSDSREPSEEVRGPAYRVLTPRLVIRCYNPADAALLKEAVDVSLDHLRPWMPWAARYPQPLQDMVDMLRSFRGQFDLGQDYILGIFDRDETTVLGGTGLHPRGGEGSREIGYWIRADEIGKGYATEIGRGPDPRRVRGREAAAHWHSLRCRERAQRGGARQAGLRARGDAAAAHPGRRAVSRRDGVDDARGRLSGQRPIAHARTRRTTRPVALLRGDERRHI